MNRDKDTICALATAHGLGAISVIRISGTGAVEITRKLAAFLPEKLESHKIYYGVLRRPGTEDLLDEVLVSYFAQGRSFTGETSFEISCHGSEIIVSEVLNALVSAGARPAERGEFTYRAFMNGRIDLVQAESVLALIESRSPRAAKLALRQLKGDLSKRLSALVDQITLVLANLEANIDFASEDIEIASSGDLSQKVKAQIGEVEQILKGYRQGLIVRNGFQVALVGAPNAGKSSLLNALAGEEKAIVTPVAGTTRDFVEATVSESGYRISFIDTAGLRRSEDEVEKIGIQRTLEKLNEMDLVLYVIDASCGDRLSSDGYWEHLPWDKTAVIFNKSDLLSDVQPRFERDGVPVHLLSATTGKGLTELRSWLVEKLKTEVSEDSTLLSNARHFSGLQAVLESLKNSLLLFENEESPDLIAFEMQTALKALYDVLGLSFDDQVMDRVFAEFCLGK